MLPELSNDYLEFHLFEYSLLRGWGGHLFEYSLLRGWGGHIFEYSLLLRG
jgi:hypothetical protein